MKKNERQDQEDDKDRSDGLKIPSRRTRDEPEDDEATETGRVDPRLRDVTKRPIAYQHACRSLLYLLIAAIPAGSIISLDQSFFYGIYASTLLGFVLSFFGVTAAIRSRQAYPNQLGATALALWIFIIVGPFILVGLIFTICFFPLRSL